jgi:hypothetical protein
MIIISHRGNIDGSKPECENNPTYIQQALDQGFDVEVDVWYVDGKFFLGHDAPTYLVEPSWFQGKALWCHAKNREALEEMIVSSYGITCFWHETDKMTLTSDGFLWMYPGNHSRLGITVWLGKPEGDIPQMRGVCTDYAKEWRTHVNTTT